MIRTKINVFFALKNNWLMYSNFQRGEQNLWRSADSKQMENDNAWHAVSSAISWKVGLLSVIDDVVTCIQFRDIYKWRKALPNDEWQTLGSDHYQLKIRQLRSAIVIEWRDRFYEVFMSFLRLRLSSESNGWLAPGIKRMESLPPLIREYFDKCFPNIDM